MNKKFKISVVGIIFASLTILPFTTEAATTRTSTSISRPISITSTKSSYSPTYKSTSIKTGSTIKSPSLVKTTKTNIKVDSGSFKTKPTSKVNTSKVNILSKKDKYDSKKSLTNSHLKSKPTYYKNYSTEHVNYTAGLMIWHTYDIDDLFEDDDDVTYRDIAQELQDDGMTEDEIDAVFTNADKQQSDKMSQIVLNTLIVIVCVLVGFIALIYIIATIIQIHDKKNKKKY